MHRAWIAVASAAHVRIGRAGGFMQINYGKAAPLRRNAKFLQFPSACEPGARIDR